MGRSSSFGLISLLARLIAAFEETQAQVDETGKDAGPLRLGNLSGALEPLPTPIGPEDRARVRDFSEQLLGRAEMFYSSPAHPVVKLDGVFGSFQSSASGGAAKDIA